jgi:hypothetical protein
VFGGMLSECSVHAVIPFINSNPLWKNNTRLNFLKDTGIELLGPHMNERLKIPNLP